MDLRTANSKNYYELLGITQVADEQEIRSHYHELARVYHPDSNFYSDITNEKVSPEQIELFKVITCAYHTLIDPKKRLEYDNLIKPAVSEKIRVWEDSNDSFFDTQVSSSRIGTSTNLKRKRNNTFGQTGANPYKSSLREEINRFREEASVQEVLRNKSKNKAKKIVIASVGMLIGVACLFAVILSPKPNNTSSDKGKEVLPQSNQPAVPSGWRNTLDG